MGEIVVFVIVLILLATSIVYTLKEVWTEELRSRNYVLEAVLLDKQRQYLDLVSYLTPLKNKEIDEILVKCRIRIKEEKCRNY